ncbi:phosphomannomutase/phosphoglucomutase [Nocardioides panacisoli]|uniref:phosphomannomutase/phosphoglucomutase n=1 Tax=Nocardioides panacisoli TaxID=627624 RepID=UPI001C6275E9|nr:phosphomannomutase/phosphoglucomutase [Nocardioides panacisoli]QYJ04408.1 phosphomannomutase/phosphoglucomutase [Nocardioides panacisoli]
MASTCSPENLAAVFKAYDVRGTVPDQLDDDFARAAGAAFVQVLQAPAIVVGYDMRPSSPDLAGAFADGATAAGADVTMVGLASTDQLYFASGHLELPGAMFTASHNPAQYNGIKLCRALAQPVGQDSGLAEIRDRMAAGEAPTVAGTGSVKSHDVLHAYAAHLLSLAPIKGRQLKVVVDAGNGMAGHTAPAVFERIADQIEVVPMYFELDGTFPHHEANPIEAANLVDLQERVVAEGADAGLAFDGDADRCFVIDERGRAVSPSTLTALIATRELEKEPGATVIHNLITSRAVPEIVAEQGGTPVRTRVGHSFIKTTMAETDAVFGGEHSGHFYFRDFWRADSGMLAALHALAALAEGDLPLSALLAEYERYPMSGEINSEVEDQQAVLTELEATYGARDGVSLDHLDGLSISHADWSLNVRASNTEPLLRLNAEGKDEATMTEVRDEALAIIRSGR